MNCLWCNEEINTMISWTNFFQPDKPDALCSRCTSRLKMISGKRCAKCSRPTDIPLCSDCQWWETYMNHADPLKRNYSIFEYNDFIKEIITKWKYRGDFVLGNIFKPYVITAFKTFFSSLRLSPLIVVPIPLSSERLYERGFNQSKALAKWLPYQDDHILSRIHNEKQAKKTRYERIISKNPFQVKIPINKPVILVDDIYTTGTTLRHAASLLSEKGCPEVYSFTLIRG